MKKLVYLATSVLVIVLILILIPSPKPKINQFTSPVVKDENVLGVNAWVPTVSASQDGAPEITAESGYFVNSKSGQALYAKNPHKRLPMASLTKVMTVLVALEHKGMDYKYTVSQSAADMEPDKMELIAGEKLTLKELLYGIFLVSANDAAEVLAQGSVGGRDEFTSQREGSDDRRSRFIKLMNDKARQLGMNDTYYANPTGLDEDDHNSYSSAYDLAILTRYLIRHYPEVVGISRTVHAFLPQSGEHQDYDMYSGINLLTTYPGVVGFKTGYTPEAGLTLITLAQRNGQEVIGVLLGSGDRRDEAKELLDYSFNRLGF